MSAPKPEDASWWDHHELTFWLWACLRNAEAYLNASNAHQTAVQKIFRRMEAGQSGDPGNAETLKREDQLASYHFLSTMGVLLRVLKRAQHLFPTVQSAYSKATHLLSEGKDLRDMVEHAYGAGGYLAGGGRHRDRFDREEGGILADATSTIIKDDGHWLGNRLNVERIITEVQAIQVEAAKIQPPK